jgi:hypothetical protein
MSSQTKWMAGAVVVAALAAAGAAFAAVELTSSHDAAPTVTAPFGDGISGSGLGGGRLGGRGLGGGLGPGAGRGFPGRGFGGDTTAAATYLGLSAAALRTDLVGGKSLADVAKAHGKPVGGLIAIMVSAQKKRLATAVASGFLTDEQAQQIEAAMAKRVTDFVNGVRPSQFGDGGPGNGAGGGTGLFGSTA